MKRRNACLVSMLVMATCCAMLLALCNTACGETIYTLINDTFDLPGGGAATRGDDAAVPLDVAWYGVGPGANPSMLTIGTDSAAGGINSGYCFRISANNLASSAHGRIWASLPRRVRLYQPGDWLQLTFDVRLSSAPDEAGAGFRCGFYDTDTLLDTTPLPTADKVDDQYYLGEMNGYMARIATGDGTPPASTTVSFRREKTDDRLMQSTSTDQYNYDANVAANIELSTALARKLRMRLTRFYDETLPEANRNGMRTQVWAYNTTTSVFDVLLDMVDNGTLVGTTPPNPTDPYGFLTEFDGVAFGNRGSDSAGARGYRVDNVVVETNVIPEPGSLVLFLSAALGLLALRRP